MCTYADTRFKVVVPMQFVLFTIRAGDLEAL